MQIIETLSPSGADENALVEIERILNSRLPADYRHFLTEVNGGRPSPSLFHFRDGDASNESVVDWFFTLDPGGKPYTIAENSAAYAGRIPATLLPIACDPFGNLLLLDLGAKSVGAIYFWDHEREDCEAPTWENVSIVAPCFSDFVKSLH